MTPSGSDALPLCSAAADGASCEEVDDVVTSDLLSSVKVTAGMSRSPHTFSLVSERVSQTERSVALTLDDTLRAEPLFWPGSST